jgi:translation initiation factor 1
MATMKRKGTQGGLVYSTEGGRMCPACRRPLAQCVCRQATPAAAGDGIVRVSRQTAGRAGKGVTVVSGLALAPDALAALGKRLRSACGAGGTVRRDGTLELQGEHRDAVVALLEAEGHRVKRAGG